MSAEKRPGGLTALAVLNFVFSGFGFLSLLGFIAMFAFINMVPTDNMDANAKAQIEAMQNMGAWIFIVIFVMTIVSSLLLLLSGIGYIKQKRVMGRYLGSTYGIVNILNSIVSGFFFAKELGGGFNLGTVIGLIYPVLTLILVNTTFREDLVN